MFSNITLPTIVRMWIVALCVLVSFLLGGIPFALLLGRLRGVDIRQHGSGNIGATNLTRTLGRRWGIAAFLLDFLKGLIPALGGQLLPRVADVPEPLTPVHLGILFGIAAVAGHVFPIYLRFRGGKGVATSFGVMTGLVWLAALISGVAWVAVFLSTRLVSLASIVAALLFPLTVFLAERGREPASFYALEGLALAAMALILIRHHTNIRRLLSGKEHRF